MMGRRGRSWSLLPRLLGSLDKGLMVFCPVLALGVAGWPAFFHRFPREAALCAGVVMGNLLLAGAWHSWEGGWSWGPRLLVPAIPLWLLPAGLAFGGSPSARWRAWIAGLVLISVAVQVPGILVKDQQIHHIGQNMLTESEQGKFPADRALDVTSYRTFKGLNVWTEHVARNFSKPLVRCLPLAGLVAVLLLGVGLKRTVDGKERA